MRITDAQTVFCPDCDEDYRLRWSEEKGVVIVTCGCDESEVAYDFLDRFMAEMTDSDRGEQSSRMFQ